MSNITLKSKGDCRIFGREDRLVDQANYGGQILTGVIWPENPITGFEGTVIQCNENEGQDLTYFWVKYHDRNTDELDRNLDKGWRFVDLNPNDPTKSEDDDGGEWLFRLPESRPHRITASGHMRCQLGELMWIHMDEWEKIEAQQNPAGQAQRDVEAGEGEIHELAARHGFGMTRTQGGVTTEIVSPRH